MSDEAGNIFTIHGNSIPTPKGAPIPFIVETLEEYLELAKAGQLRAIAVAIVIDDGTELGITEHTLEAATGEKYRLLYSATSMMRRLKEGLFP